MARALLILLLLAGSGVRAQTADTLEFTEVPAQLVIAPAVHAALAYGWDHGADTVETGYCVAAHDVWLGGVHVIFLDSLAKPDTVGARNAYRVAFRCADDKLELHTHTDVTCTTSLMLDVVRGSCVHGGEDAWECEASPSDELRLTIQRRPVAFVQCDRNAIVAYYPMRRVALQRPERAAEARPAPEPESPGASVTIAPAVQELPGLMGQRARRP